MDVNNYKELAEAYQKVNSPEQLDEISAQLALTASQKADEKRRIAANAGDKETAAKKAAQASRIYKGVGPRRTKERMSANEEVDIFDYMLEYLVAEGYADTNKAALAIMANMSEEWKQSIIDEAHKPLPTQKMQNRRYYVNMKTGEAAGSDRNERIRGVLDAYKKDPEGEAAKAKAKSKYKG